VFAKIAMWLVSVNTVTGNLPFWIARGAFIVGRTKSAQIVIGERTISRNHARISYDGRVLVVEDLDSSNGTFVNETAVSLSEVNLGDHVRFGSISCAISATAWLPGDSSGEVTTFKIPRSPSSDDTALMDTFTAAQRQIIPLLMQGKSEPEIAHVLGKSFHTVHAQVRAIFERAAVHSRAELIVKLLGRE
jgi:DNA-binding CsgD family transcriptional regulator